ncbi:MAG: hypothetical protein ACFE8N_04105 [Promethearchaeota archaeon]
MSDDIVKKMYEKITVNLPYVDLGKIDYFVEQGFYNSRAEFIRIAVKNEISKNNYEIETETKRLREEKKEENHITVGIEVMSRSTLESVLNKKQKLKIFVVGLIKFSKDVDLELVKQTIESCRVYGIKRGPPDVVKYLEDLKNAK